jgi:hypothetical protein
MNKIRLKVLTHKLTINKNNKHLKNLLIKIIKSILLKLINKFYKIKIKIIIHNLLRKKKLAQNNHQISVN